jgi:hypothetical protein
MSDNKRVYRKVTSQLKKQMPTQSQGHVVTLAMMITGIVCGKKAQLGPMSNEVPDGNKDQSVERRLRRWVGNPRVSAETYFMPFAQAVLASLAHRPLALVMDGSVVGRGCMALMLGVVYQHRVLPLVWVVYKGKKGHAPASRHQEVLELVQPLIPADATVILLGDGEYDTPEMLSWVSTHTTWFFVSRTASNILVSTTPDTWVALHTWHLQPGDWREVPDALFTQRKAVGPYLVIGGWDTRYDEPLYLVTNFTYAPEALYWYHKRYRIETFFSDQKSRGFHIHKSHLADPARLARLLIAACLAYIWIIYLGVTAVQTGCADVIDRHDRRDLSLFQMGLRWLTHLLKWRKPLPIAFNVPPS